MNYLSWITRFISNFFVKFNNICIDLEDTVMRGWIEYTENEEERVNTDDKRLSGRKIGKQDRVQNNGVLKDKEQRKMDKKTKN